MISFSHSLKLAQTKFKNRKMRHVLSGFAVSLGITIILTLLFAATGILDIGKKIFVDQNAGRYFAGEGISQDKIKNFDPEAYKKNQGDFSITNVFTQRTITRSTFGLENLVADNQLSQMEIRSLDALFASDFIDSAYSFDNKYDGKIPVVIPKTAILKKEYKNYDEFNQKQKYDVAQKTLKKYLGKEVNLTTFDQAVENFNVESSKPEGEQAATGKATGIKLIIVGFSSTSLFSTQDIFLISDALLIPNWAFDTREDMKQLLTESYGMTAISEFKTKAEREAFLRERNKNFNSFSADNLSLETLENGPLIPIDGRYELFADIVNSIKKVGYGIGGFFLAISGLFVLTTVGKIIGDSKKEIGLYRAVGATKKDIYKIVMSYALLIVNIGFGLGFGIALLVTIAASQKWGSELFYMLLNFSTVSQVELPKNLFLHVPVLTTLVVYIITLLVGCLACVFPARKAAHIDPAKVLKEE